MNLFESVSQTEASKEMLCPGAAMLRRFAKKYETELFAGLREVTAKGGTSRLGLLSHMGRCVRSCLNLPSHATSGRCSKFGSPRDATIRLKLTIQVAPEVTPENRQGTLSPWHCRVVGSAPAS